MRKNRLGCSSQAVSAVCTCNWTHAVTQQDSSALSPSAELQAVIAGRGAAGLNDAAMALRHAISQSSHACLFGNLVQFPPN